VASRNRYQRPTLAAPIDTATGELIVVVGSSLGDRNDALDGLTALFLIGARLRCCSPRSPAISRGAALRPVEAMRQRAAAISASRPEERLPIPPARDQLRRLGLTLNEMLARSTPRWSASAASSTTPATSCERR